VSADPPIDPATVAQLLEAVGSDPAFLDELADAYLAEAPGHLAAARGAIDAHSTEDLVRPAHTLKSSSATFGALVLAGYARELEQSARAGSLTDAGERIEQAEEEFRKVAEAMAGLRADRWRPAEGSR
jgi:HPt (histidine-containing phosphotransfer) domain-containing protein